MTGRRPGKLTGDSAPSVSLGGLVPWAPSARTEREGRPQKESRAPVCTRPSVQTVQRREPLSQPEREGTLPKSTFSDASGRPTPRAGLSRESRQAAGSTLSCTLGGEGHTGTGKGAVPGSFRWCGRWYLPNMARIPLHLTSHHMGLHGPH